MQICEQGFPWLQSEFVRFLVCNVTKFMALNVLETSVKNYILILVNNCKFCGYVDVNR